MSVEEIIKVTSLSISLFITVIGFVVTLVKAIKIAIKTKNWSKLKNALQEFIAKAEEFEHYTGAEKKEIVLAWASNFCSTIGMKFEGAKVSAEIEELVSLTKQVNQREKDKQAKIETEIIKEGE